MQDLFTSIQMEIRSLETLPYDPGMAVEVIDTIDDPTLPEGQIVIQETLSPMVLWREEVVKTAEVVTHRGTVLSGSKVHAGNDRYRD